MMYDSNILATPIIAPNVPPAFGSSSAMMAGPGDGRNLIAHSSALALISCCSFIASLLWDVLGGDAPSLALGEDFYKFVARIAARDRVEETEVRR